MFNPKPPSGIVYDAVTMSRILDIPVLCNDPAPLATRGGVVGYYDGWDLPTIRSSAAGKQRMRQGQGWYDQYPWQAEPGYYETLFQTTKRMVCLKDLQKEDSAWQACPIIVGASILLAHMSEAGKDLLKGNICRFKEPLSEGNRSGLMVHGGWLLVISALVDDGYEDFFAAFCRKLEPCPLRLVPSCLPAEAPTGA